MNKRKNIIACSILLIIFVGISILNWLDTPKSYEPENGAEIQLYGESHGIKEFYEVEFSAWKECYENKK